MSRRRARKNLEKKQRDFNLREDPNIKNDMVLKMEKKLVNKYGKKVMRFGIVLGIVIPPYILYWKQQQMKVRIVKADFDPRNLRMERRRIL